MYCVLQRMRTNKKIASLICHLHSWFATSGESTAMGASATTLSVLSALYRPELRGVFFKGDWLGDLYNGHGATGMKRVRGMG